ncbi:MAG: hypothetical protein ABIQ86_00860 [Steroidobacteraceae bacterium]
MASENEVGESLREVRAKRDVQFWLDVVMKLTVPLGAIVAAWLANHFEQNRSNLQLINQREQAESSLRATMFGQLITPIAGPGDAGAETDPVRYAVLAQLLTLNFHEHFELKPLLQDADDRLSKYKGTVAPDAVLQARSNLRQAAHRVIQRQIAQLWEDEIVACTPAASMETTFQFVSDADLEESFSGAAESATLLVPGKPLKSFIVSSPDCRDKLSIVFDKPDFFSERVHVLISPAAPTAAITDYRFDFDLTSFAFPFTDNAVLPKGNRFAFFIKDVSELDDTGTSKIMRVGLRWFPQNYYPPTERPTDYKEFRRAMGNSGK